MIEIPVGRSELKPQLLGLSSLSPFPGETSSARAQMWTSHMGQTLVVKGATPPRIMTGCEADYGNYTFKVRMPANATIVKVIQKYPKSAGYEAIEENPLTLVIYEDADTRQFGVAEVPLTSIRHQHFGFRYKATAAQQRIYQGSNIGKGTILSDSPNIDEYGNYNYGVEANVALMSVPGIIEDGVIVSEDFVKKISSKGYKTVVMECGKKRFPLNLYGKDSEDYKPFPDIGQVVNDEGLLFALREYNPILAPVLMSPKALRTPEHPHDVCCYATPGARVVDVKVLHDNRRGQLSPTPSGMEAQMEKYSKATSRMYKTLLETYHSLKRERKRQGRDIQITDQFQTLLQHALSDDPENSKERITRTYRNAPLDDWRVEITLEYDVVPGVGAKITGADGDKGVICAIWKTEDMPVDQHGNRADFIMDGDSTGKRMNIGRMYRMYIAANMAYYSNVVRDMVDKKVPTQQIWDMVLEYYSIISPKNRKLLLSDAYKGSPEYHIESIVKSGFYATIPTDNTIESPDIIRRLRKEFPLPIGPVTYRGRSGRMVTTKSDVLIGGLYILTLEKDGKDWAAVASAKIGHFGFPSKIHQRDRYSEPGRSNPTRITGEAEVRLFEAVAKGSSAELIEMSNNPITHRAVYRHILTADKPTAIAKVVDRQKFPRGRGRNLGFMKHIMACGGVGLIQIDPESGKTIRRL